jgi:hypothetical protein
MAPARAGPSPYTLSLAATTAASTATDPTERSIPPEMMTNVMPSAVSA